MRFSQTPIAAFAALAFTVHSSPISTSPSSATALFKRANYPGCNDKETAHIDKSISQVTGIAVSGYGVLSEDKEKWSKNKGYTHYFKEADYDRVKEAYRILMSIGQDRSDVKFNVKCGKLNEDCDQDDVAYADPTPEDFQGHGHTKGTRMVVICPQFFTNKRTTGELPPSNDEEGLKKFCDGKETKKVMDYEVGGHTLMHEFSHLDSFGRAAGYPEMTNTKGFEYKYHGTIDWSEKSTAHNARVLKTSKAKNKPETWQNAESLAAAGTEMGAMWRCDVTNISD